MRSVHRNTPSASAEIVRVIPVARLVSAITAPLIPRAAESRTIPCRAAVLRGDCLGIRCSSCVGLGEAGNALGGKVVDSVEKKWRGIRADASTKEDLE